MEDSSPTIQGEYVTTTGRHLTLRPVNQFLVTRLRQSVKLSEPPTYTITTAAGTTETHPHDEETIKDATDAEKAAWEAYQQENRVKVAEYNERFTRMLILKGVVDDPPINGWIEEQREFGIDVPDDPKDLKVHWLTTEAIGTTGELPELLGEILRLGGLNGEALREARESFRRSLRSDTARPTAHSEEPALEPRGAVQ